MGAQHSTEREEDKSTDDKNTKSESENDQQGQSEDSLYLQIRSKARGIPGNETPTEQKHLPEREDSVDNCPNAQQMVEILENIVPEDLVGFSKLRRNEKGSSKRKKNKLRYKETETEATTIGTGVSSANVGNTKQTSVAVVNNSNASPTGDGLISKFQGNSFAKTGNFGIYKVHNATHASMEVEEKATEEKRAVKSIVPERTVAKKELPKLAFEAFIPGGQREKKPLERKKENNNQRGSGEKVTHTTNEGYKQRRTSLQSKFHHPMVSAKLQTYGLLDKTPDTKKSVIPIQKEADNTAKNQKPVDVSRTTAIGRKAQSSPVKANTSSSDSSSENVGCVKKLEILLVGKKNSETDKTVKDESSTSLGSANGKIRFDGVDSQTEESTKEESKLSGNVQMDSKMDKIINTKSPITSGPLNDCVPISTKTTDCRIVDEKRVKAVHSVGETGSKSPDVDAVNALQKRLSVSRTKVIPGTAERCVVPVKETVQGKVKNEDEKNDNTNIQKTENKGAKNLKEKQNTRRDQRKEETVCVVPVPERKGLYWTRLARIDDFALNHEKLSDWIFARFLTNEEFQMKMAKNYRKRFLPKYKVYPSRFSDDMQRLFSYLLSSSFRRLSSPLVAFLLSPEHVNAKGLKIPEKMLGTIGSVKKYIKQNKNYKMLIQEMKKAEERLQHQRKVAKVQPIQPKEEVKLHVPAYITLPPVEKIVPDKLDFDDWYKSFEINKRTGMSFEDNIVVAYISEQEDMKGFDYNPRGAERIFGLLKYLLRSIRNSKLPEGKGKEVGGKDEGMFGKQDGQRLAYWTHIEKRGKGDKKQKYDPLIFGMHRLHDKNDESRKSHRTDLSSFYRSKPYGCSIENLTSYPWIADCAGLVTKVRCFVRINTSVKNDRVGPEVAQGKKNKGRRPKKGRGKSRLQQGASTWVELPWDSENATGDGSNDGIYTECQYSGCKAYFAKSYPEHITAFCKSVVAFPFYERATNSIVFYHDVDGKDAIPGESKDDANLRRVPNLAPNMTPPLKQAEENSSLREEETDWVTMSDAPNCVRSTNGIHKHHNNLMIDILIPTYYDVIQYHDVTHDVLYLLRSLTKYCCSLHAYDFNNLRKSDHDAQIAKHIQTVQLLCECVFSFLVFCEVCGPAEMGMRAAHYVTTAYKHYEEAADLAIKTGILIPFTSFLRDHVSRFPTELRLVRDSSVYSVVLSFLDVSMVTNLKDVSMSDFPPSTEIEPIAVSILESVLGKGYDRLVDDDIVFRYLNQTKEENKKTPAKIAVCSPVLTPTSTAALRWKARGVGDLAFTHKDYMRKLPSYSDDLLEEFFKEIFPEFLTYENKATGAFNQSPLQHCTWSALHHVLKKTRTKFRTIPSESHNVIKIRAVESPQSQDTNDKNEKNLPEFSTKVRSGSKVKYIAGCGEVHCKCGDIEIKVEEEEEEESEKTTQQEEAQPKAIEETATTSTAGTAAPTENQTAPEEEKESAEVDQDAEKTQKSKKANRAYLSSAKRQERQVKKLRKKWEKKHKVVSEQNQEES